MVDTPGPPATVDAAPPGGQVERLKRTRDLGLRQHFVRNYKSKLSGLRVLQRGRHSHHYELPVMKRCLALFPLSNMAVGSINVSHIHKSAKTFQFVVVCSSLQISRLIGLSQQIIKNVLRRL